MRCDPERSDDRRLVYHLAASPWIGLPLALLGLGGLIATAFDLGDWVGDFSVGIGGGVFSLVLLLVGGSCLYSQTVTFDREAGEITKSARLILWHSSGVYPISAFHTVEWKPRINSRNTCYPIRLIGREQELNLWEVNLLAEAGQATRQIGEFLQLSQRHWDETVLEQRPPGNSNAWQVSVTIGRQPMRRVHHSETKVVYAQSVEMFLKIFAAVAGPLGLLLILSHWLGIEIQDMERESWALQLVGGTFLTIALFLLLFRSGFIIDRQQQIASRYWGLPWPLWQAHCPLANIQSVAYQRYLDEGHGHPAVLTRLVLIDRAGEPIVLMKSNNAAEIIPLAQEIAVFLDLPLVPLSAIPE